MYIMDKFRDEAEFRTLLLTIASGAFLIASFFKWFPSVSIDPAWVAIVISGTPIVYGAIMGLITDFDVTADVLVAIALIAAVIIGEYFAAGEVAFIMQLGAVLEDITAGKSHKSLESLIKLTPQKAYIRTVGGEEEILASEVRKGDLLLIRPGEAIPVDGKIIRGSTSINQAIMTGESFPVDKDIGDEVYQGTINQQGVIDIEATKVGEDSSLEKMIRLVEDAENNKAPIVRITDKWARILVPVALACAILILILTKDIYRAVTALVVFCPCSLILATPTAMMAAIGNATKKGIIIKSGAAVEAMSRIDTFVLDKTGTMTYGKLQVEDIHIIDENMDSNRFLYLVASAERFSEHPVGKAIVTYSNKQGVDENDPETFEMLTGKGVVAMVDGYEIRVGEKTISSEFIEKNDNTLLYIKKMQEEGKTVLPVSLNNKLIGIISIADALRKDTKGTIEQLKTMGLSRIVMLTGDHQVVANSIGKMAGVTDIVASQLPEDKVSTIKALMAKDYTVGMIGDGVNDAPALATADVGIVMGAIGSDIAIDAADIALMSDEISKIPFIVNLCKKTRSRIIFNIVVSMIINFGAIVLAGYGILNPVTAALVHNFGSVFVVINSALLLSYDRGDQVAL